MFLDTLIPLMLLRTIFGIWTASKACTLALSVGFIIQRTDIDMYKICVNASAIIKLKTFHAVSYLSFR
jgi:hypothetical protein